MLSTSIMAVLEPVSADCEVATDPPWTKWNEKVLSSVFDLNIPGISTERAFYMKLDLFSLNTSLWESLPIWPANNTY